MRKILVGGLTAGLVMTAPIAARAASFDYRGGCGLVTVNDPAPGGHVGGQDPMAHIVYLAVVPTDPAGVPTGATVTVSCDLLVNGVSQGPVLGPTTGKGVVVAARPVQYYTAGSDVVSVCENVTVGSETIVRCHEPVDAVEAVIDLLDTTVVSQVDPAVCTVLVALAPAVNGLGHPELVRVEPTGDLYVLGEWIWDCPPYGS